MKVSARLVLDTSVVVSALVFGVGWGAQLRAAWQAGRFVPLASAATTRELIRVLGYPKFKLSLAEQEELLADYLPWVEVVRASQMPRGTPVCRDRFDQPLDQPCVDLALASRADALVSGDGDLLAMRGKLGKCQVIGVAAITLPVEIYAAERVHEFDDVEAELAKVLTREPPPMHGKRRTRRR